MFFFVNFEALQNTCKYNLLASSYYSCIVFVQCILSTIMLLKFSENLILEVEKLTQQQNLLRKKLLKDHADFEKVIKNEEIKNQELVREIEQWRKKFKATKIVRKYYCN